MQPNINARLCALLKEMGLASLSFDLSVFDLFGVLAGGGRLVLPAPGAPDPEAWLALLEAEQVTVCNTAPPEP